MLTDLVTLTYLTGTSRNSLVWQTEWVDLSGNWTNDWDNTGVAGEGLFWATKLQDTFAKSSVSASLC